MSSSGGRRGSSPSVPHPLQPAPTPDSSSYNYSSHTISEHTSAELSSQARFSLPPLAPGYKEISDSAKISFNGRPVGSNQSIEVYRDTYSMGSTAEWRAPESDILPSHLSTSSAVPYPRPTYAPPNTHSHPTTTSNYHSLASHTPIYAATTDSLHPPRNADKPPSSPAKLPDNYYSVDYYDDSSSIHLGASDQESLYSSIESPISTSLQSTTNLANTPPTAPHHSSASPQQNNTFYAPPTHAPQASTNPSAQSEPQPPFFGQLAEGPQYDMRFTSGNWKETVKGRDWSSTRLKLPSHPSNRYYLQSQPDKPSAKWDYIQDQLSSVRTTRDLEIAIKAYNPTFAKSHVSSDFTALHYLSQNNINFESKTLPYIIQIARELPQLLPTSPPLLFSQKMAVLTFDQKQCVSLLANMFLCTFPRRLPRVYKNQTDKYFEENEYSGFPDVHFYTLFMSSKESAVAKLHCIAAYFEFHRSNPNINGAVMFRRVALTPSDVPTWSNSSLPIIPPDINAKKLIEDISNAWQADFANKSIGGGVLGSGCVQEEIRFCVSPELFIARLIAAELADNEAMLVSGSLRYSTYTGYSDSFRFNSSFRDEEAMQNTTHVMIFDALSFESKDSRFQFRAGETKRELEKAVAAFSYFCPGERHTAVATGKWGCGAFAGNVAWKFLIQLLAASSVGRSMVFCTLNDSKLTPALEDFSKILLDTKPTIQEVYFIMAKINLAKLPSRHVTSYQRQLDQHGGDILHYVSSKLLKLRRPEGQRSSTTRKTQSSSQSPSAPSHHHQPHRSHQQQQQQHQSSSVTPSNSTTHRPQYQASSSSPSPSHENPSNPFQVHTNRTSNASSGPHSNSQHVYHTSTAHHHQWHPGPA